MRRSARAVRFSVVAGLLLAPAATAQTLDQVCPGAKPGTGALWGSVMDSDADVVLPRATVSVAWDVNGEQRGTETRTGADGLYVMCLPLETSLLLHASFATTSGLPVQLTLTETFTRQDLTISTSSGGAIGTDDRLWLCINGGQSVLNYEFTRLIRCENHWQPLEQCPTKKLGRISVQPVGAGSGMLREMIEQLVQEAKRIGANAVINVTDGRGGTSFGGALHSTTITGEGVLIEVDPATCR